ncbi:MAG: sugar phosphate isomerase/epimerase [Methanoregula sp.]|nr:sugar phosphate isomerase/epimerase [Methanoregula sp.]
MTMPVFAVSSMFFHEYTLKEIFSYVGASGLNGMEIWIETPDFWLRDCPVDEVIACKKNQPEIPSITVHAPVLDLNPCSINPRVAAVSLEYIVRSIRLAELMGAGVLTVHPGRRTAKRPPSDADFARFDRYITILREAATTTEVKIGMENMEPIVNSLLCTPERMRELLDAEPWLLFTLDVSHAISGKADDLVTYLELCADRLTNVHISRVEGKRLHLPLDNHPDMARVIGVLGDCGYAGPFTLEIDDLNFTRPLTAQEKVAVLSVDRAFLEHCFC